MCVFFFHDIVITSDIDKKIAEKNKSNKRLDIWKW